VPSVFQAQLRRWRSTRHQAIHLLHRRAESWRLADRVVEVAADDPRAAWRSPPCIGQEPDQLVGAARSRSGSMPGTKPAETTRANRFGLIPNRCTGPRKVCCYGDRRLRPNLTGSWATSAWTTAMACCSPPPRRPEFAERFLVPLPDVRAAHQRTSKASSNTASFLRRKPLQHRANPRLQEVSGPRAPRLRLRQPPVAFGWCSRDVRTVSPGLAPRGCRAPFTSASDG